MVTAASMGIGLDIPWFFWTPKEYWFFGVLFTIYHMLTGFLTVSMGSNMTLFYALHFFLYSKNFSALHNDLCTIQSELQFSKKDDEQLEFIEKYLSMYHRALNTYCFYRKIANLQFITTYTAHSLIMYYVFFGDIPLIFRVVLLTFGLMNFFTGLSTHFFVSSMVIDKVCLSISTEIFPQSLFFSRFRL